MSNIALMLLMTLAQAFGTVNFILGISRFLKRALLTLETQISTAKTNTRTSITKVILEATSRAST
jgi:hypothetical protein